MNTYNWLILHLKNSVTSRFDLYSQKVALARMEKSTWKDVFNLFKWQKQHKGEKKKKKRGGGGGGEQNTQNGASRCDLQTLRVLHADYAHPGIWLLQVALKAEKAESNLSTEAWDKESLYVLAPRCHHQNHPCWQQCRPLCAA